MLLNLGMTADAAAAHHHEYSPSPQQPERQFHMSMTSFFPSLTALRSVVSPFAAEQDADHSDGHSDDENEPQLNSLVPTSEASEQLHSSSASFQSSNGSNSNRKASSKSKTSFHLAHPPPTFKSKNRLKISPKLLLQLQVRSTATRCTPTLDVIPSSCISARLAGKSFPRIFRGRDGLGPNDLVVVTSDALDFKGAETAGKEDNAEAVDQWDEREVVATVCQGRRTEGGNQTKTEITLSHGSPWEASHLPNGAYEFVSTDEHGLKTTVRWVSRVRGANLKKTNAPLISGVAPTESKRFIFSVVRPNTRRHPIIASMTRKSIDVLDEYCASVNPTTPSPTPAASVASDYFDESAPKEQALTPTDDRLRSLIVVTGIWVAFKENWSSLFSYDATSAPLSASPRLGPTTFRRATSNVGSIGSTSTFSADGHLETSGDTDQNGSSPRPRATSLLGRSSPTKPSTVPQRSSSPFSSKEHSTGAAFIRRANNRSVSGNRKATITSDEPRREGNTPPTTRPRSTTHELVSGSSGHGHIEKDRKFKSVHFPLTPVSGNSAEDLTAQRAQIDEPFPSPQSSDEAVETKKIKHKSRFFRLKNSIKRLSPC